ncbi:S8 family serine peptidase [Nonomuraea aurantiaca]|uniref:S8 family serine peptidase n=1 Tax=Nonomuraea aurantiaca TaxID=2878562 RepID=UPI001CDA04B2|nr:S8 family serine peptidase [Nonomuraea aurantiaca]MCA2220874.1 S8 family serine peptidase [Nonomuraea aurantiaca]
MKSRFSLLTGVMVLALTAPGAAVAEDGPAPPAAPVTVTLITGDRVTLTGPGGGVLVERGAGRTGISFAIDERDGRLRVLPSDAAALVRRGQLDPRLFDVTMLAAFGYDDRRGDLPLIVTGSQPALTGGLRSAMSAGGVRVTRELGAVSGLAVQATKKDRARFWSGVVGGGRALSGGVGKIWLDGLRKPTLDVSVKQIGAPAAWERGYTGAGVKVAVLDTGVDATHPDLVDRVSAQADFTGSSDATDRNGHGTHIASTIAGSGSASGGTYKGVAPAVSILAGKVCVTFCEESAILAGMQWAGEQGAKVVNLSLGGTDTPEIDPLESAVATLTQSYGMLFVVAAGNSGNERSVESPASADAALAVGAVTKSDELAEFSSRGPRAADSALKPEITAPGEGIVAARAKDARFGEGSYVAMSGTSMSTPHVAGAAAILAGQHPGWSPGTLKAALMGSASPNPAVGVFDQGAGRVDVGRATAQAVTAEPGGVGFGVQQWPHDDDEPLTRQVTYRNQGAAPVTLKLSVEGQGDAKPFTVNPTTVTVPAGGQAEVSVTADTAAAPVGYLGGYLVAAGGDVRVSTPLAVEKERETYALTLKHTGRDGSPTADYLTTLHRTDSPGITKEITVQSPGDGPVTLRLPKGGWMIRSTLFDGDHTTQLIHPGLDLAKNQTLDLDARLGKPLSVTVPDPSAAQVGAQVTFSDGKLSYPLVSDRFENLTTAQLGPDRTYDGSLTQITGTWAPPGGSRVYRLAWFHKGGMVTGFRRKVATRDLAAIHTTYAAHLTGGRGRAAAAQPPGGPTSDLLTETTFSTPSVRTEYVNADGGAKWRRYFWEDGSKSGETTFESTLTGYTPGRAYQESWNLGVFSPVLTESGGLTRSGDSIRANMLMYGDGAGHAGWAATTRARVALYRDGVLVAERSELGGKGFRVPPGAADYRLVVETERGAPATLTTRTSAAWTFRSEHTDDDNPLPVSVVRSSPALDTRNTAPSGETYRVPVRVERQQGSTADEVRALTVEVSFDDGATWSQAQIRKGQIMVNHPAREGFVSLRAKAADSAGNTVEQTVIRAYRIAPRS